MLNLFLHRFANGPTTTAGYLVDEAGKKICFMIEPAWLNNGEDSCIPAGTYTVRYKRVSPGGSYTDCYHVEAVQGRSGILIHKGNTGKNTLGCILPNSKLSFLGEDFIGSDSAFALSKLHAITGRQDFKLHIRSTE